ncbi:uncharacterized protein PGTG_05439 [Puccinia graminis f. sp. tritici CRL 75-36-700-3]|uniref:Uncharacterized protein n=1 Tax=Puccinia graminis f. sp. tritici (strain CRL 75-36-700-3 / race SCCL) TaxID=418459 RepID=E3K4A8_PUCGT|nr:uncharacterized protein PGTG_05439 [Puccinia graminis f. sp. tritici CRL 75-36-700-3]EFP79118.1 hypothetical protein PGTG_05439 [Puccinia graminis f. sp. tritici CRL 75-36-700-3]
MTCCLPHVRPATAGHKRGCGESGSGKGAGAANLRWTRFRESSTTAKVTDPAAESSSKRHGSGTIVDLFTTIFQKKRGLVGWGVGWVWAGALYR